MDMEVKIEQRKVWDEEASCALAVSTGDEEIEIAAQVNKGICKLFKLNDGSAWLVTRLECPGITPELVVVCFEGEGLKMWSESIIEGAKKLGCKSIRFHTKQPAVARVVRSFGVVEVDRIYKARL